MLSTTKASEAAIEKAVLENFAWGEWVNGVPPIKTHVH